jgi:hypothetical protein
MMKLFFAIDESSKKTKIFWISRTRTSKNNNKKCSKTKILFTHTKIKKNYSRKKLERDAWIHHEQTLERAERHVRAVRLVQSADERYSRRRH